MGRLRAQLGIASLGDLPADARAIYSVMALEVPDNQEPAYYWQRDPYTAFALALGRRLPDPPPSEDKSAEANEVRRKRKRDLAAVNVHLAALREAEVIEPAVDPAHPDRSAWRLLPIRAREWAEVRSRRQPAKSSAMAVENARRRRESCQNILESIPEDSGTVPERTGTVPEPSGISRLTPL